MKIAVVGSRSLTVDLNKYLPLEIDEIVSAGAKGIDTCARDYANAHGIKLTEFLPRYEQYGRAAPIKRNREIIDYSDKIYAFWNGESRGTYFVIEECKKCGKPIEIYIIKPRS